jgi:hypothetical protein
MGGGVMGSPLPFGGHTSNLPVLWTARQVAARLGVSVWFVYDHGQELGLVKVGGANRYRPEVVEAFVERGSRPAAVPVRVGSRSRRSRRERPGKVRLLEPATELRPESEAA